MSDQPTTPGVTQARSWAAGSLLRAVVLFASGFLALLGLATTLAWLAWGAAPT